MTGLEPNVGRTLRASRLCLRLRGTFARRGGSPVGLKGVDSSPSWAGAHPSRKAPKMTCRVSSSVTPENESYFSGSIDPGAQWPRVPSPRVSTKPCLRSCAPADTRTWRNPWGVSFGPQQLRTRTVYIALRERRARHRYESPYAVPTHPGLGSPLRVRSRNQATHCDGVRQASHPPNRRKPDLCGEQLSAPIRPWAASLCCHP